jgi:hypothetical protein
MLQKVDKLLEKYEGRNGKLCAILERRYGANPAAHTNSPNEVTSIEQTMRKLTDSGFLAPLPKQEGEGQGSGLGEPRQSLSRAQLVAKHQELRSTAVAKASDPFFRPNVALDARAHCYTT